MDTHPLFPRHDGHGTTTGSTMDPGMDMGSGSGSDTSGAHSSTMMAVFQTSMATSLYSANWTPNSTGTYAATCIFLIVFAALFRGLLALRSWQEHRWMDRELDRRFVVVDGKAPLAETLSRDSLAKNMTMALSANGVEENVLVVRRPTTHARPWRLSVDPVRAVIDTAIAGVGYLLMLAVMSMNVGYFLSILGGTFVGSLLVGRFIAVSEH
ncbi:protein P80 [Chaetomidium leptoderma]|uniref:Copper transport protein n=1 Tax=Chaetomidium leptoderma TaxID=669021 RepID=A0AAN6VR11_9PEZI|nr:protein P80 [Chaetomidium leptoderma]